MENGNIVHLSTHGHATLPSLIFTIDLDDGFMIALVLVTDVWKTRMHNVPGEVPLVSKKHTILHLTQHFPHRFPRSKFQGRIKGYHDKPVTAYAPKVGEGA